MPTLSAAAHLGHSQTRIRWQSPDATGTVGVGVKTLVVEGWGPAYAPSFVAGYENLAVAGTSRAVSGLAELTTYYFRVRAENAAGESGNSPTASATTLETQPEDQTITFPAIGDRIATNVLTLSATASSGLPVDFAVGSGPATISNGTTLAFSGAGTVRIVASQAGDASWNPAPSVTNTFVVTPAAAGVSLGGLSHVYDGNPQSATATTEPAGLSVAITYDGGATAPSAIGSYEVVAIVVDALYAGGATGILSIVETLTDFQQWLEDRELDYGDSRYAEDADDDLDGMTTYEEYLADTDPADPGSVLALSGTYFTKTQAGDVTGQIRFSFQASTNRFYQLEYCTGLTNSIIGTTNLGWGVPGMVVTNNAMGTWYGVIRVYLQEP
jgi:hypothetical protein